MNIGFLWGLDNEYLACVQIKGELWHSMLKQQWDLECDDVTEFFSVCNAGPILRHMSSLCLRHSPDFTLTMNGCHWVLEPRPYHQDHLPAHCVKQPGIMGQCWDMGWKSQDVSPDIHQIRGDPHWDRPGLRSGGLGWNTVKNNNKTS